PGRRRERNAALHRHARKRPVPALHEEGAVPLRRPAEERRGQGGRPNVPPGRQRAAQGLRGDDGLRVSRPRAAILVTGSELVRGERTDRNGPFYAREALSLGMLRERILIFGDDPADLEAALRAGSRADVCLVSGGLGPTHDDRTVELVARVAGASLRVDEQLEREIEGGSRSVAERLGRPYADFAAGVTKQATIPEGAEVIGVAGTAPGLVLRGEHCVYVVLPGPPGELRRLSPAAVASEALGAVLRRTTPPGRHVLRLFGVSEYAVAQALADAGGDGDGVEATICARDFEIHVDLVVEPDAEARGEALAAAL